jgi:hypothetical protein
VPAAATRAGFSISVGDVETSEPVWCIQCTLKAPGIGQTARPSLKHDT